MSNNESLRQILDKIEELKSCPLLPRNFIKIIAGRLGKSESTIRQWSLGLKNVPDGPITVLKLQKEIIEEKENEIENLSK